MKIRLRGCPLGWADCGWLAIAVLSSASVAQTPTSNPPSPEGTRAILIRNATIVPVTGPRIETGSILLRGGRIEALGPNVTQPADASVIDGTGLFVYPGMIDGGTQLGLTEIGSVPGGEDTEEIGDFNPHNVALTAVNPHSELIPVTRVNGVTTAITAAEGGLISGQAGLIDLIGWTPAEMAVRRQAAIVVSYPSLGGGGLGGGGGFGGQQRSEAERREELDRRTRSLRSYFADARAYTEMKGRVATGGGVRKANPAMEAMTPIMRGEMPVIFDVTTADQIRGVLALADTFALKVVLRGAREAWRLADTLAMRKIPVIVGPLTSAPGADDPYDMTYANPGVLARAGVKIAFQTSDAANSRNLPYNAALAVAYGLEADAALRALTINAAEIFGVADRYGSLAPGKVANVVVTTGDPMDVRSVVRHLFIRGQPVPLDDRHTRLYEQFRARPRTR
jgi:imidazolonepropionase-like amidohydrolase